jgi:hypothetical protein
MWIRLLCMGLTIPGAVFAQAPTLRLGEEAKGITAQDRRGAEVALTAFRQKKMVVLVVQERGGLPAPGVRDEMEQRLEPLGAVALYLSTDAASGRAQPGTVLIDAGGTVRRVAGGRALTAGQMAEFVSEWRMGQGVFEAGCARCHGEDGALDICMDVKPLVGIGRRLNASEIRERLRMAELNPDQYLIRSRFYKKAEVDAVIAYISGL